MDTQTLPVTGNYTMLVSPDAAFLGSVTLTLYDVPADVTGTVTTTITVPGQNGELTFSGTSSQQVTVHITSNAITCVTVKLMNGATQMTATTSCASSFNLAAQTLPATGTYTIKIDPSAQRTGSINISVTSP